MARTKTTPVKGKAASKSPKKMPKIATVEKAFKPTKFTTGANKPHRFRPGTVALREIRKYQKMTDLLLPKSRFQRVVREIAMNLDQGKELRWQASALGALQEASEAFLVAFFEDVQSAAIHGKRVTIMPSDMGLVRTLRTNVGAMPVASSSSSAAVATVVAAKTPKKRGASEKAKKKGAPQTEEVNEEKAARETASAVRLTEAPKGHPAAAATPSKAPQPPSKMADEEEADSDDDEDAAADAAIAAARGADSSSAKTAVPAH
jgi:histone H3